MTGELCDALAPCPEGLERCPRCFCLHGIVLEEREDGEGRRAVSALCLCYGVRCTMCGEGRRPRPGSTFYGELEGRLLHVPLLAGMAPCRVCSATGGSVWRAEHPELVGRRREEQV